MPSDRAALGAFLRSRRDRLTPAQAGMRAFPGSRRVPGLRRGELAVLAGMSPDYYSRLEQGRQANISIEVLDALARALRLNEVEHTHLRDLGAASPRRHSTVRNVAQRPDPGMLRLMIALDHLPVLLLGYQGEVLARNALLRAVLGRPLQPGNSFLRFLFLDPIARDRILNWSVFAQASVAALRMQAGRRPRDGELLALIGELRRADPDVARWGKTKPSASTLPSPKPFVIPPPAICTSTSRSPHHPRNRINISWSTPSNQTHPRPASCPSWRAGTQTNRSPWPLTVELRKLHDHTRTCRKVV